MCLMNKTIVFTGGGTAGHVTPNIALIERLRSEAWQCIYIGSSQSIEEDLMAQQSVRFFSIATGKLRRYFSWQNFLDPFKILYGTLQAFYYLKKIKPTIVFSKGGFVSFPVVLAAWLCRIPLIAHESDLTPGLTTKLSVPFVRYVCVTFDKAKQFFKNKQHVKVTGTPLRQSLFKGEQAKGLALCQFDSSKPCLLIIGGGLGSVAINTMVRNCLDALLPHFHVVHLCGKGKVDESIKQDGYRQFDYVNEEMPDLYAMADLVISRSGANSVCEILALNKPHIFIPLPLNASRGDQIHNAKHCQSLELSRVLDEETLTVDVLCDAVNDVHAHASEVIARIKTLGLSSGTDKIIDLIKEVASSQ